MQPALATPRKQDRPSLTTLLPGSRLRSGQLLDLLLAEALDPAQLQAHRLALGRGLDRGDDRRLAGRTAAALAAGALAAEIGVVDLDPAGQAFAASRSIIACISLCLIFQAVVWVTPSRRPSSRLEIPPLLWVRW